MARAELESLIPIGRIGAGIHDICGQNLMLDADLAELNGVGTKALNQGVAWNSECSPADLLFRLFQKEFSPAQPRGPPCCSIMSC